MLAQALNDQAVSHIAQAAERLQEVQDYLDIRCREAEKDCIRQAGGVVYLELTGYGKPASAFAKRAYKALSRPAARWNGTEGCRERTSGGVGEALFTAVREVLYTAWRDAGRAHRSNGFFGQ